MESLLVHPGPATSPQASENPPGPEVTPLQVMAVEPSTLLYKCSPVPCKSPCPHAICAVAVELPGSSHLLPCAVPTGVGPPKPDRNSRTGCWEGRAGAARLCPSVPFPRLVLSGVCMSCGLSGRSLVPQQRKRPCRLSPACGVRAHAPRVCHVCVSTACLLQHPACLGWFV